MKNEILKPDFFETRIKELEEQLQNYDLLGSKHITMNTLNLNKFLLKSIFYDQPGDDHNLRTSYKTKIIKILR